MSLDRSWRSNFGRANAIALIVNAPKALWHELGTNHIPPRPFLSIAAISKEHEIQEMMGPQNRIEGFRRNGRFAIS
jgi:hypothetical protein